MAVENIEPYVESQVSGKQIQSLQFQEHGRMNFKKYIPGGCLLEIGYL